MFRLKCNVKEWCFMLQVEMYCEGIVFHVAG